MRTYSRIGCTIKVDESAEELLNYQNISIDQFVNHLYLFLTNQPVSGIDKVYVHASKTYTGKAHFLISFSDFDLPKYLIPQLPSTLLEEMKTDEPEIYAKIVALNNTEETRGEKKIE